MPIPGYPVLSLQVTPGTMPWISANSACRSSASFSGDAATCLPRSLWKTYSHSMPSMLPSSGHPTRSSHLFLSTSQLPCPHHCHLERYNTLPSQKPFSWACRTLRQCRPYPVLPDDWDWASPGWCGHSLLATEIIFKSPHLYPPIFTIHSTCSFLSSTADHNNKQVNFLLLILKVNE